MLKDTFSIVTDIIATTLDIPASDITGSTSFDELGADSLDELEALFAIEKRFGIEIGDDETADLWIVDDLVRLVHSRRPRP